MYQGGRYPHYKNSQEFALGGGVGFNFLAIGGDWNAGGALIVLHKRVQYEPRCEKTGLRGFRPGPTQTGLCSHRIWLEA